MSNTFEYITYGTYDQITQAFNMMSLIFADNRYAGMWFIPILIGLIISFYSVFSKGIMSFGQSGVHTLTSWLVPVIAGFLVWSVFINKTGYLQVMDVTLGKTQQISMPYGIALTAGVLNQLESGLVDIISNAGDVNSPNDYRKFSGGAGFDMLTKTVEHKASRMDLTYQSYYTDCFLPQAAISGGSLDIEDFKFGTPSGVGFWALLAQGSTIGLEGTDYTGATAQIMSCDQLWATVVFPHYDNANNFTADTSTLCSEAGYDPANAMSSALCREKIQQINEKMGGHNMSAETFVAMKHVAEMSMQSLNSPDPAQVTQDFAGKTLQAQGQGIGVVITKYAPLVRSIMTAIVIGLMPILCIFLPTPIFGRVLMLIFSLWAWLTMWTVADCVIHTTMQYYISNNFASMRDMGNGIMYYMNMPSKASEAVSMFGYAKGLSIMVATVVTGGLGLQASHAMASLAGGMQSNLQSAGQQAGHVGFTPEGRAGAIDAQHRVGESMTNANKWTPGQMFHKGEMSAASSMHNTVTAPEQQLKSINSEMSVKARPMSSQEIMKTNDARAEKAAPMTAEQINSTNMARSEKGLPALTKEEIKATNDQRKADNQPLSKPEIEAENKNRQEKYGKPMTMDELMISKANSNVTMATPDGQKTFALSNGKQIFSDLKSGHSANMASDDANNASTTFSTTNLGAVGVNFDKGLQNTFQTAAGKASKVTESWAAASSENTSAIISNDANFVSDVNKNKSFTDAQKKSISDQYNNKYSHTQSAGQNFVKGTSLTEDEGVSFAQNVSAELSANASAGLSIPLTDVKAGVAAKMLKSGAITNASGLKKALSNKQDKSWNDVKTDAEDWSHTVSGVQDFTANKTNGTSVKGADSLSASWKKQAQIGENFNKAKSTEESVNQTVATMQTEGFKSNFNGAGMLYDQLVTDNGGGDKGKAAADKILIDSNKKGTADALIAKGKIEEASGKVFEKIGAGIMENAGKIENTGDALKADVSKTLDEKRETQPDIQKMFDSGKADVDAKRIKNDVEAGHKIKGVNPNTTPEERKSVRGKIPPVVNTSQGFIDSANAAQKKLDRLEHPMPGTKAVSAVATLAVGPKVGSGFTEGSGMVTEAITHPMDTIEEFKQTAKDLLRKK